MRTAVIMTAFDRPHYLKRVLASLDKLDGLRDLPLFFYVDGPYDEASTERCAESARLCKNFRHPQKTVVVRGKNAGIANQIYESKHAVFSAGYDAVVSLQDDVIVAPYGLEAVLVAYTALRSYITNGLFTVDIYNYTQATYEAKATTLNVLVPGKDHGAYIMPKEVWYFIAPLLAEYIHNFIEPHNTKPRPYTSRSSRSIQRWFGSVVGQDSPYYDHVTGPKYPSSQDGCVAVGILKHGITALATEVNHVGYIGERGEHMTPALYEKMGFGKLKLHLFDRAEVLSALSTPTILDRPRFVAERCLL